ncbi:MAG: hypothetical protein DMD90_25310 [Candidatus Rokuibacteriota bacterium]|nr:MAG: hypothetical protein DMD90_25310 [Candidatus Rokubacteria bacterium]
MATGARDRRGTAGDKDERDYRYGVIPEALLSLRLIVSDQAMLEAQARQYWIVGLGAGASPGADQFGHELINRANVGLTVRVWGPHAPCRPSRCPMTFSATPDSAPSSGARARCRPAEPTRPGRP